MRKTSADHEILMRTIKERRSVRTFRSEPVEKEKIEKIIEAARWAPSGGNRQPWEFIVITCRKTISALKPIMTGVMGITKEGSALICICVNKERKTCGVPFDIGCALQNMLLCAHSLGLGSCAIMGFDGPLVAELLDLPDILEPALFIMLGHPEKNPPPPIRRGLNELIFKRFE